MSKAAKDSKGGSDRGGSSSNRTYCYFDYGKRPITDPSTGRGNGPFTFLGRVVMELYNDICPKTADNFRALCTGEHGTCAVPVDNGVVEIRLNYELSPIHRIVKGGWVQGGDIVNGFGNTGASIYAKDAEDGTQLFDTKHKLTREGYQKRTTETGESKVAIGSGGLGSDKIDFYFPDESFVVPFDSEGILAMANDGEPHTNMSQYFISLGPLEWMETKAVAFGQVVSGIETLYAMEKLELNESDRPMREECSVIACGETERPKPVGEVGEGKQSDGIGSSSGSTGGRRKNSAEAKLEAKG